MTRLHHMGITVSDTAKAVEFYRALADGDVVGPLVRRGPVVEAVTGQVGAEIWITFVGFADGETVLELADYRNAGGEPLLPDNNRAGSTHPAIVVPSMDDALSRLAALGYAPLWEPLVGTAGPLEGYRYVYVLGPDELRVELLEEPHPATAG
ncbi:VOC family protein [Glaciibacter psychrotolerans]|uniref:Catechol 2,3-dioxygenase-like lactoylglutathione lyase family enzyme n=1 Tax=Glaciibacter psychrotolerans TaxID=670054 RepID=A0A7Z0J6F5_9MICO|nr:VOC family protein [Leifsonia psychrotolerans]NYJ20467.1 catechol 2,3-dioxygenase-like lactoylglutathione lyase family enzyme [Leifsonia psychrotolerans]